MGWIFLLSFVKKNSLQLNKEMSFSETQNKLKVFYIFLIYIYIYIYIFFFHLFVSYAVLNERYLYL